MPHTQTRGNLIATLKLPKVSHSFISLFLTLPISHPFPISSILNPKFTQFHLNTQNGFQFFKSESQIPPSRFPLPIAFPSILSSRRPWRLRLTGSALSSSSPAKGFALTTMIPPRLALCFPGCSLIRLGFSTTSCAAVSASESPKCHGASSLLVEILAMQLPKPFSLLASASLSFDLLGNLEMDSLCSLSLFVHYLKA